MSSNYITLLLFFGQQWTNMRTFEPLSLRHSIYIHFFCNIGRVTQEITLYWWFCLLFSRSLILRRIFATFRKKLNSSSNLLICHLFILWLEETCLRCSASMVLRGSFYCNRLYRIYSIKREYVLNDHPHPRLYGINPAIPSSFSRDWPICWRYAVGCRRGSTWKFTYWAERQWH